MATLRLEEGGGRELREWREPVELAAEDLPAAVETLASAFRDNPLNVAVIGESARRRIRANRAGNRASLAAVHGIGLCLGIWAPGEDGPSDSQTGKSVLAGVLVAEPPGVHPLPPPSVPTQLRVLWEQGWRVATTWSEVHFELESRHPREPHWVLDMLGVAPEFQGRGIGTALLRALHERVDAEPAPSYLETDREENVAFYERASYTVLAEGRAEAEERIAGVPVWRMWREPRSRQAFAPGRSGS